MLKSRVFSFADIKPTATARLPSAKSTNQVTTCRLDRDLLLLEHNEAKNNRPLVLMYSWLTAKQPHVNKYAEFYTERECNVLTIKLRAKHILSNKDSFRQLSDKVTSFIHEPTNRDRPLISHTFSAGILTYAWLVHWLNNKHPDTISRFQGEVHDSSTPGLRCAAPGIPQAIGIPTQTARLLSQFSIDMYLKMRKQAVADYIQTAEDQFWGGNPTAGPFMFMYCRDDALGDADVIERLAKVIGESRGKENVYMKAWDKSKHVSHLHCHPEEYKVALNDFLDKLNCFKI